MLYFVRKANAIWERMLYGRWWLNWDLLSDAKIATLPAVDVELDNQKRLSRYQLGAHRYKNLAYETQKLQGGIYHQPGRNINDAESF